VRWSVLVLALAACDETNMVAPPVDFAVAGSDDGGPADLAEPSDAHLLPDLRPPPVPVVYVSGYSPQIARFDFDPATGKLTNSTTTTVSGNPSFLAVDPARRHLYALDESTNGLVRAFDVDGRTGALAARGIAVSSGGNGPAHLSVDPLGKWVLVANYGDGKVTVLPIESDGSLGPYTDNRMAGMNAHEMLADESDTHVFVPCLGSDYIAQYLFDATQGRLTANAPATAMSPSAMAGPRHLALTPGFAYVIEETDSKITAYTRDAQGKLLFLQSQSTLAAGTTGTNTAAEIAVHGRFLYGSNRGDDSIVQFSLGADGHMTFVGVTKTLGKTPRHFSVDPSGRWLLVANQDSNEVRVFSLDPTTGVPTATTIQVTVPKPSFVAAYSLPGT
jgi:6-phosphogluconolactonase